MVDWEKTQTFTYFTNSNTYSNTHFNTYIALMRGKSRPSLKLILKFLTLE